MLMNGRSVWADYLTDDPTAWRVRVGEHHMFSDVDEDQVDVDVHNIIFHPNRDRKRSFSPRFRLVRKPFVFYLAIHHPSMEASS